MSNPKENDQYVKAVEYSHTLEKLLIMERENISALRNKLEDTERERDELRLEIARIGGAKAIEVLRRDAAAGEPVAVLYRNGDILTKAECGEHFEICCKVEPHSTPPHRLPCCRQI